MKVIVAKDAGYCYGVERALRITLKASTESPKPIFTLGPIIHNPQVVESLKGKGVVPVQSLSEAEEGTIIIRSHGIDPRVVREAKEKGLIVIDATCPIVKKAQHCGQQLIEEGYELVIVGERDHPEVKGIVAYAHNHAVIVEEPSDLADFPHNKRVGVIIQTTQPFENLLQVVNQLLPISKEVKIFNTICDATTARQEAARKLSNEVDVMVVVGGKNSANTTRLAEICRAENTATYHVETEEEIDPKWFSQNVTVGVTAGASTPDWLLEAAVKKLEQMNSSQKDI
jgi:4-hydroxy-3-methylbut-2-enyl diphosphate reductase